MPKKTLMAAISLVTVLDSWVQSKRCVPGVHAWGDQQDRSLFGCCTVRRCLGGHSCRVQTLSAAKSMCRLVDVPQAKMSLCGSFEFQIWSRDSTSASLAVFWGVDKESSFTNSTAITLWYTSPNLVACYAFGFWQWQVDEKCKSRYDHLEQQNCDGQRRATPFMDIYNRRKLVNIWKRTIRRHCIKNSVLRGVGRAREGTRTSPRKHVQVPDLHSMCFAYWWNKKQKQPIKQKETKHSIWGNNERMDIGTKENNNNENINTMHI